MLELDYIFEDYLDNRYFAAPEEEQRQFLALLDEQDPDLQGWLLYGQPCPRQFTLIISRLRGL